MNVNLMYTLILSLLYAMEYSQLTTYDNSCDSHKNPTR